MQTMDESNNISMSAFGNSAIKNNNHGSHHSLDDEMDSSPRSYSAKDKKPTGNDWVADWLLKTY